MSSLKVLLDKYSLRKHGDSAYYKNSHNVYSSNQNRTNIGYSGVQLEPSGLYSYYGTLNRKI